MSEEAQLFATQTNAVLFLQKKGFKIGKSKFNKDFHDGLIPCTSDKRFRAEDLLEYADRELRPPLLAALREPTPPPKRGRPAKKAAPTVEYPEWALTPPPLLPKDALASAPGPHEHLEDTLAFLKAITPREVEKNGFRQTALLTSRQQFLRSEDHLRDVCTDWCRGWAFAVHFAHARALDIAYSPRYKTIRLPDGSTKSVVSHYDWTQGSNFYFSAGYTLYDSPIAYDGPWKDYLKTMKYCVNIVDSSPASEAYVAIDRIKNNATGFIEEKRRMVHRDDGYALFSVYIPNEQKTAVIKVQDVATTQTEFVHFLITGKTFSFDIQEACATDNIHVAAISPCTLLPQPEHALVHEMRGIAKGIVADGKVVQEEAAFLKAWLDRHAFLAQTDYAVGQLHRRVTEAIDDGVLTLQERREILNILRRLILQGMPMEQPKTADNTEREPQKKPGGPPHDPYSSSGKLKLLNPISEIYDPVTYLDFSAYVFCFTGIFAMGDRKSCEKQTERAGGHIVPRPQQGNCCLVVGSIASPAWAGGNYGRKIETALRYRHEGSAIRIISEDVWAAALVEHTRSA